MSIGMFKLDSIHDVVKRGLCLGCGACVSAAPEGQLRLKEDPRRGLPIPISSGSWPKRGEIPFEICPGKGMPLQELGEKLFGESLAWTPTLGRYRLAVAAHSTDSELLEHATSGAVMTAIALDLLNHKEVDGVTVTRFVYGPAGPRPVSYIARNRQDLLSAQGSKYCPTSTNLLIRECLADSGRYLFVGTPCQVGSLRQACMHDDSLKKTFPYTMANFCGGFRDLRQINWLIRKFGLNPKDVTFFRHRGGGQPGSMKIEDRDGRQHIEPYPAYYSLNPISKNRRCALCIDGTGHLADFACGDAWVERFLKDRYPWSIILARSQQAQSVIQRMQSEQLLVTTDIAVEEILYSQRSNLNSKITRQYKRRRLMSLMGLTLPEWDVKLPVSGSYYQEIRTLILKWLSTWRLLGPILKLRNTLRPRKLHSR